MVKDLADTCYAYAQLGLDHGAPMSEILEVQANAKAYRFVTRARLESIAQMIAFFNARAVLGGLDTPFAAIKKAYHQKAMSLHPDRNKGDYATQERLKEITIAYALVDKIHRIAIDYYKQNEELRRETENEARQQTLREKPQVAEIKSCSDVPHVEQAASPHPLSRRYMAASVPRFLRQSRLGYLPLDCIIGSHITRGDKGNNLYFDVIMLPPREFQRMRHNVGLQYIITPHLQMGSTFNPCFILTDTREVTIPADEPDPLHYARKYFLEKFGLATHDKDDNRS
jgi:hypothetical protein